MLTMWLNLAYYFYLCFFIYVFFELRLFFKYMYYIFFLVDSLVTWNSTLNKWSVRGSNPGSYTYSVMFQPIELSSWDNTCTILCWAKQQGLVRLYKNASVLLWDDFGSTMPILVFIQNNGGIEPFSVKPYMVDPRFD
jgi:hypothetical protein